MFEVAEASKNHRDIMLVRRLDHFLIADGPSRLDDRRHPMFRRFVNRIPEREKRVRGHDAPLQRFLRLVDRQSGGVHPAHLSGAQPDGFLIPRINNGIGFNMLGNHPCEF